MRSDVGPSTSSEALAAQEHEVASGPARPTRRSRFVSPGDAPHHS